jgi:predicted CXXCH cytochrome family protein
MTREATSENVKADFSNAVHSYRGLTSRFTKEGESFWIETVDPGWAEKYARVGGRLDVLPPVQTIKWSVDRLVGSHWLQECLHRAPNGQYIRLPLLYHLAEHRWIHSNGAFLAPDSNDFWARSRGANWNESCLYCHNTEPSKNPIVAPGRGVVGYETEVGELGIACAACHGHGTEHVESRRNPDAKRAASDVVHPARLPVPRRDAICGRCHGALAPKPAMWDAKTHRDPFTPGQDLTIFNHLFRSEAEQAELAGLRPKSEHPPRPEPTDGRFWGDGTPLTTALEYNGMLLSACYKDGQGTLSCLSCHTMHGDDPNLLLKPKMQSNEACYQCHADFRDRLSQHTRHPTESSGSLCYNCHMPHQVYSLMTTHRSHRIQTPSLAGSLGTGKPHACNLCHLDKSLGWTRDQLLLWPNGQRNAAGKLSADEESLSSAVFLLIRGDARSRAIVAGAFSNPAARLASGTDWTGSTVTRILEHERYPVVRYLAHRGIVERTDLAEVARYDYLATPDVRTRQLEALRVRFDRTPIRRTFPYLPLTANGLPDERQLLRLRQGREDPDLTINE